MSEEPTRHDAHLGERPAPAFVALSPGTAREKRQPVLGRLVVGRECAGIDESRRLLIDDPTVSRHHLEIRAEPDLGGAYAVDVSANGTRVNGTRIARGVLVPLTDGDRLEIGDTELRFEAGGPALGGTVAATTTVRGFTPGPMAMVVGDIVGFTRIAELNDSAALTRALDELFGGLRSLLRRHGGMLANYAGDAFFGAWELDELPDGTERALGFSLEAAALVRELAPSLSLSDSEGRPLRMGWGVAVGEGTVSVLTGALTTVVGDAANVAFRLSALAAREGRGEVLVRSEVRERTGRAFTFGAVEQVALKGRDGQVAVLALEGDAAAG